MTQYDTIWHILLMHEFIKEKKFPMIWEHSSAAQYLLGMCKIWIQFCPVFRSFGVIVCISDGYCQISISISYQSPAFSYVQIIYETLDES